LGGLHGLDRLGGLHGLGALHGLGGWHGLGADSIECCLAVCGRLSW